MGQGEMERMEKNETRMLFFVMMPMQECCCWLGG